MYNRDVVNIYSIIKRHWVAIMISLLVGIIVAGPNLVFTHTDEYQGIPMIYTDFESYYLARINAAYQGCVMGCNPFTAARESLPFFDPSISTAILALPGMILNLSTIDLKLIYELLLPFILSLLLYFLLFRLTKRRVLSIAGTIFIMLGYNLVNSVDLISLPDLYSLLSLETPITSQLLYVRLVNPTFSSIIFVIFLHIFLTSFIKPNIRVFILIGLFYGFSYYIYFYTYTFISAVIFSSIIIFLMRRKLRIAGFYGISFIIGLLIGSPILLEMYNLVHHPWYAYLPTNGIIETHMPYLSIPEIAAILAAAILFAAYYKKIGSLSSSAWFIIALISAGFAVKNQHVITGTVVQYFHYDSYYMTPVFIISLCLLAHYLTKNIPPERQSGFNLACIALCILPVMSAVLSQRDTYRLNKDYTVSIQKYAEILEYIGSTSKKGSVISAPDPLRTLILIHTTASVPWSYYTVLYLHNPEEPTELK